MCQGKKDLSSVMVNGNEMFTLDIVCGRIIHKTTY